MRSPTYLSPTSMSKWSDNPQGYYLKYLSDIQQPEEPQTRPMSVGSAFDAYVKSFLYEALFGSPHAAGNDVRFSREAIFEEQVEQHNRDWAKTAGEHCFSWYRILGALDGLMIDLGKSKGPPKFEMDVRGPVSYGRFNEVSGQRDAALVVPFRVKPDLHYVNEHDAFVILDWKVNGYCSASGRSPTPGFIRARRTGKMPWTHDAAKFGTHRGILMNIAKGIEHYEKDWARQCAVGAWVCGAPVGSDFITVIHQLACGTKTGDKPKITVAEHVGHITPAYQEIIHDEAVKMWTAISEKVHDPLCLAMVKVPGHDGWICECPRHVFRHIPLEDSIALCTLLDNKREVAEMTHNQFISPALDD